MLRARRALRNDYGIVRFTNSATPHPNNVTLYNGRFQSITTAADPVVGQTVSRSGRTTQVRRRQGDRAERSR